MNYTRLSLAFKRLKGGIPPELRWSAGGHDVSICAAFDQDRFGAWAGAVRESAESPGSGRVETFEHLVQAYHGESIKCECESTARV